MRRQVITKIQPFTFKIYWEDIPKSELILKWKPLIDKFRLQGNFALLHWQAKPKYYRRFGFYYSPLDQYFGTDYNKLIFPKPVEIETLQLDESKWGINPVGVIALKNVVLKHDKTTDSYLLNSLS